VRRAAIAAAVFSALVAGDARADRDDDREPPKLGLRVDFGALPYFGQPAEIFGLGVGVEHPAFCKFRVFGEYEWLFLTSGSSTTSTSAMPEYSGTGQRAHVGLRHVLVATTWRRALRLYIDGEIGGGFALTTDNASGTHAVPHALAGLRLGYDILMVRSHVFEAEFLVRGIAIDHGAGMMFGVGMLWGG
jgi:hypothetical protein